MTSPVASPEVTGWGAVRLNYKGPLLHDNRRLLEHRANNCECLGVCYRELLKLPPAETRQEYAASIKTKIEEKDIKKAIRRAKKEVRTGKQSTIRTFFRATKKHSFLKFLDEENPFQSR